MAVFKFLFSLAYDFRVLLLRSYYENKEIHVAEIDMHDDRETVAFLFRLCNILVEELISKKKGIKDFYNALPEL